jgi:hypothetical protein
MKPIDAKIPKHVEPIGQGSFGVDSQPLTNSRLADVAIAPEEEDLFFYKVSKSSCCRSSCNFGQA